MINHDIEFMNVLKFIYYVLKQDFTIHADVIITKNQVPKEKSWKSPRIY